MVVSVGYYLELQSTTIVHQESHVLQADHKWIVCTLKDWTLKIGVEYNFVLFHPLKEFKLKIGHEYFLAFWACWVEGVWGYLSMVPEKYISEHTLKHGSQSCVPTALE